MTRANVILVWPGLDLLFDYGLLAGRRLWLLHWSQVRQIPRFSGYKVCREFLIVFWGLSLLSAPENLLKAYLQPFCRLLCRS